jgi:hypothetical protein
MSGQGARRWPLLILSALLVVWEPLSFALFASSVVTRLMTRGAAAFVLLGLRLAIVSIGVAAGLSLWNERPGALVLARAAIALSVGGLLITTSTSALPDNRPPGTALPTTVALVAYNAAWFAYLTWVAHTRRLD